MKLCHDHWHMLQNEIDKRGLSHLISSDHEGIMSRALDGSFDLVRDFDPLLMANFLIWRNAIEIGGAARLVHEPHCPLCERRDVAEEWITDATNDALNEARRLNLVPTLQ